ncbi:MAG: flagellar hook-associated protein FlgL [Nitrospirota bacterium]
MRITSFAIFNQLTRSLSSNLSSMAKLSNMLATNKKINSPSDDVSGMMKAMDYKVSINQIEQYRRNIDEVESYLSSADTALFSVTSALDEAKTLAVQAANTPGQNDRAKLAEKVAQLRDHILELSNSRLRNRYIFSGYKTSTAAFDSSYTYQGDSNEINILIDNGYSMTENIIGSDAFSYGGVSFMKSLDNLYTALTDSDPDVAQAGAQTAIDDMSNALDQVANTRAGIGARLNSLDAVKYNLDDRNVTLKTFLSDVEDTDIAYTVSEISKTEVALQSLRQSGAEILSQSLLDFLN